MLETRCAFRAAMAAVCALMIAALPAATHAATLTVGPGQAYATVAAAVGAAQDGDTVAVLAGVYVNDFPHVQSRIALTAVGGRVRLRAAGFIPNGKGIMVVDDDVTVTGFDFVGARVTPADGANGAGIRYESGHMVLNDCYFANNQDGILANAWAGGTITINASEFFHNGAPRGPSAGYTHNIYVNDIDMLDIENSYFHGAQVGHEIKSRAAQTIIRNTRVADGLLGTASYGIDLPNGGVVTLQNVQVQKGPLSENPALISFGEEGAYAGSSLTASGVLLENLLLSPSVVGVANRSDGTATLTDSRVFGLTSPQVLQGAGTASAITWLLQALTISSKHPWQ